MRRGLRPATDRPVVFGVRTRRVAAGLVALTWCWMYGIPIVAVLLRSLEGVAGGDRLSFDVVGEVLADPRIGRLALITLLQAVCSTVIVVVCGVPLGWALARLEFRGRRTMSAVVMVPFVLPALSIALAVVSLGGGVPAGRAGKLALIIAAHVVFNLGLMARSTADAVASVPADGEAAARSLGRGAVAAAWAATIRRIGPSLGGTALIIAIFCITSFGVVVAIGGAAVGTIEVEIWTLTTRSLDLARAAVLVMVQLVIVGSAFSLLRQLRVARTPGVRVTRRVPVDRVERAAVAGTWLLVGALVAGPLGALVARSLRRDGEWTVDNFRGLPLDAVARTVVWAVVAMCIALLMAAPVAVAASRSDRLGRWCDSPMMLPFAMSAATLGVGYLVGFAGPAIDLRGRWILIPMVQAAGAAPVVVRLVVSAMRSLDTAQLDAAAAAGAGPARRAREVVWPAMRRTVRLAAGVAFAMSVGEFGATVFLARPASPTVSVIIGRLVGRPGSAALGQATALSVILGVIAAVSVVLAEWGDPPGRARRIRRSLQ